MNLIEATTTFDIPGRKHMVYLITCEPTGGKYVGCTFKGELRFQQHFNQLRAGTHPSKMFQGDFKLHGAENFSVKVLELCDNKWDARNKEREHIALEKASYNKHTRITMRMMYENDKKGYVNPLSKEVELLRARVAELENQLLLKQA